MLWSLKKEDKTRPQVLLDGHFRVLIKKGPVCVETSLKELDTILRRSLSGR